MTNETDFIYKPTPLDLMPQVPTYGVKFSEDCFIPEYLLIDWNIDYKQEDLEDNPFGRVLRIKKKKE